MPKAGNTAGYKKFLQKLPKRVANTAPGILKKQLYLTGTRAGPGGSGGPSGAPPG